MGGMGDALGRRTSLLSSLPSSPPPPRPPFPPHHLTPLACACIRVRSQRSRSRTSPFLREQAPSLALGSKYGYNATLSSVTLRGGARRQSWQHAASAANHVPDEQARLVIHDFNASGNGQHSGQQRHFREPFTDIPTGPPYRSHDSPSWATSLAGFRARTPGAVFGGPRANVGLLRFRVQNTAKQNLVPETSPDDAPQIRHLLQPHDGKGYPNTMAPAFPIWHACWFKRRSVRHPVGLVGALRSSGETAFSEPWMTGYDAGRANPACRLRQNLECDIASAVSALKDPSSVWLCRRRAERRLEYWRPSERTNERTLRLAPV